LIEVNAFSSNTALLEDFDCNVLAPAMLAVVALMLPLAIVEEIWKIFVLGQLPASLAEFRRHSRDRVDVRGLVSKTRRVDDLEK
jgi:hypothetical protein